jgi:hypothetical protein
MNKTQKKIENIKNRTKKRKDKIIENLKNIKNESVDVDILCKKYANTYTSFESKEEEIFKKNKIDISSANYNLEKAVVKNLKKAVSPSKIKPNDDYYSYINERWIEEIQISSKQGYIVQVDDFRLVQDKVFRQLLEIVDDYVNDKNPQSDDVLINAVFANIKQQLKRDLKTLGLKVETLPGPPGKRERTIAWNI